MDNVKTDVAVIGAGPGGYVAAIRAAQLGMKTTVIEKGPIGGVCLNWGCIPSKALLHAAGLRHEVLTQGSRIGLECDGIGLNLEKMLKWKNGIVTRLQKGISSLFDSNGIRLINGTGTVREPGRILVRTEGEDMLVGVERGIVAASGARPVVIPGFEPDGKIIIDTARALSPTSIPESLLVIGGGVIGLELGTLYAKMGSRVTIVEIMDQILPGIDPDLVQIISRSLRRLKIAVHTSSTAAAGKKTVRGIAVAVRTPGKEIEVEAQRVLVAAGFRSAPERTGLGDLGVKFDHESNVTVDGNMETSVKGIYAVGDLTGPPYLAHRASHQGITAAEAIAGIESDNKNPVPSAIFTDPQIGSVGISENDALRAGMNIITGRFAFTASGRALAGNSTDGIVKVIADVRSHEIVGLHLAGPECSELVALGSVAVSAKMTLDEFAQAVQAHPTLAECVHEAVLDALGKSIHSPAKK